MGCQKRNRSAIAFLLFAIASAAVMAVVSAAQVAQPPNGGVISLSQAIHLAQQNEANFSKAVTTAKSSAIDAYLAKTTLLPSVTYHNQVLYTQPNGQTTQIGTTAQSSPVFIANNAVHEYTSQASINETVGLKQLADAQAASANATRTSADMEVARRGLVSTVVALYYSVSGAEKKQHVLEQAFLDAKSFTDLTQKRENGREVAHADVVKAQLQQFQRQRDLSDATLAAAKARLELGVLLFPDPRTPYSVENAEPSPLPSREEVNRLASTNNPELRSALADVRANKAEVMAARAAYLPDLGLNFSYGIDAPEFAKYGPDKINNLGYSISGTLDIPIWDWFATGKRVKQSELRRDTAIVSLTATQRKLIATLEEAYAEAAASRDQLDLLDQSVQTAAESLRLTQLRYGAGEATALEVVDAQTTYVSTETAQADGVSRYQNALAALQELTGTL